MKDKKNVASDFANLKLNKKFKICHSIDIDSYRILCKDFFDKNQNRRLEIDLANEDFEAVNESENLFVGWLKMEWYDKKRGSVFCGFKPS